MVLTDSNVTEKEEITFNDPSADCSALFLQNLKIFITLINLKELPKNDWFDNF